MKLFAVSTEYLKQQQWPVKRVILVENETNVYMLPCLPDTLVICSYGKALHLLKEIPFLDHCQLYYWGDMDAQGFEMLHGIRKYYNHIRSLFMDDVTVAHHHVPHSESQLAVWFLIRLWKAN